MKVRPPFGEVVPWPGGRERDREQDYERVLQAVERRLLGRLQVIEQERGEAGQRLAELLEQPPERREMLVRNHSAYWNWGLLERLVEQARERGFADAAEAEALGRLALVLADRLDAAYYGEERIEDLRARAWSYVANARRIRTDFRGATVAFQKAETHLRRGTGDPLERAQWLDLRASLMRDLRRFDEAGRLLMRAVGVYRELGEMHRVGRALVKLSTVHEQAGAPERAIPLLHEAVELIDGEREPRLLLSSWHNLITNLADAGRCMEAQGLLIQARPLYARSADAWTRDRRHWVEGKIASGLGQLREAEACLRTAREGFIAGGLVYEAAVVSLDLASLYAREGRPAELKSLAEEMIAVFSSLQIQREALTALAFLHRAALAERASLEVVTGVSAFLKRLRHEPDLAFRAPLLA